MLKDQFHLVVKHHIRTNKTKRQDLFFNDDDVTTTKSNGFHLFAKTIANISFQYLR